MKTLSEYLDGFYSCAQIDLKDKKWHTKAKIPSGPGWYFIHSDVPIDVLLQQALWQTSYSTKTKGKTMPVKNYDLSERASRYAPDLAIYWNTYELYSGKTLDLLARAREHTYPDPGTAGLALSRYPALFDYKWLFGFLTLNQFLNNASCQSILLHLGEQIWRSKHKWPLLCAE